MKVCLFLNKSAGEGLSPAEVTALVERAGHTVEGVVEKPEDLDGTSHATVDCVVAAGGDGTVARAARILAGGDVPLAILGIGTANNVAVSLGLHGTPEEMIAAWQHQQVVRIDAGIVRDADGESPFFESVGAGLVAAAITRGDATISADADVAEQLQQARVMYADMIDRVQARRYDITIDGVAMSGEYLLVEVLNMPSVGPNVRLTAEVSPADGLLSLVVAAEADREPLAAYLRARAAGGHGDGGLKSWRGRRITIDGLVHYHVDDRVITSDGRPVSIEIKPAHLPVLA